MWPFIFHSLVNSTNVYGAPTVCQTQAPSLQLKNQRQNFALLKATFQRVF